MDFARVLQLVDGFLAESGRPYGVIGAIGVAAIGVSRTTFERYGLEALRDRLD